MSISSPQTRYASISQNGSQTGGTSNQNTFNQPTIQTNNFNMTSNSNGNGPSQTPVQNSNLNLQTITNLLHQSVKTNIPIDHFYRDLQNFIN